MEREFRSMRKQKVLIIVGPTASGKSALAVSLAREFGGEVVSADSRQVYRGLDIGSAKITRKEMKGVSHHLLDEASPRRIYTAFDFVQTARKKIGEIESRGRLPIVAGGTGFYIDALTGRIELSNVPADPELRKKLESKTNEQLFIMLKRRDEKRARVIDRRNKRRLIRAIEIAIAPRNTTQNTDLRSPYFEALWLGLRLPNEELRKKIRLRAAAQVRKGLAGEGMRLRKSRVPVKRIREFGFEYSLALDRATGKISKSEFLSRLESQTWQYARRQMRYWKRNRNIKWFKPSQKKEIFNLVSNWLG